MAILTIVRDPLSLQSKTLEASLNVHNQSKLVIFIMLSDQLQS